MVKEKGVTDSFTIKPTYETTNWNSSSDPLVFTHDSDIHINRFSEQSKFAFRKSLQTAELFNPSYHLITGDLSDNFDGLTWPKYADQDEEAWIGYKEVIDEVNPKYEIIDLPGNHDMWGIESISSKRHYLLDYTRTFRRNNTQSISSFQIRIIKTPEHPLIILNPFRFPTAHCCFLYWVEPTKAMLDDIQNAIDKNPHAIVMSHFPPDFWRMKKSSKGLNIRQILDNPNVDLIITGHHHPKHPLIRHHGKGIMEVCGVGGMNHTIFGVVTEDNNRFVYHEINHLYPPIAIITHPAPIKQVSTRLPYNDENTEIRILSYIPNLKIKVSGAVTGNMSYTRQIKNGLYLYSHPLNLPKGRYTIYFSGDFNEERTFIIGEEYRVEESPIESMRPNQIEANVLPFIFILFNLILFPVNVFNFDFLNNWIEGKDGKWYYWIFDILFGFIAVRSRILKAPLYVRIILYIATTWPICLPTSIMELDKKPAMIFSYGYVASKQYLYASDGPGYTYTYYQEVVIPATIFVSGLALGKYTRWPLLLDFLYICYYYIEKIPYTITNPLSESVGKIFMYLSPCFMFMPIAIIISILVWICFTIYNYAKKPSVNILLQTDYT